MFNLIWPLILAVSAPPPVPSPSPPASPESPAHFRLVPVGRDVYTAVARTGDPDAGGNAGFVVGDDSVLVVDTFLAAPAAEELLAEIRKRTPLPVRWAVNTHYHLDHLGGNAVLARAGAAIVAQENVRAWTRTENLKFRPNQKEAIESLTLPNVTYREGGLTLWLGSRRVDVFFRAGHTGGDSIVSVPEAGVVFAGDLFWNATLPNLIDADTAAWVKTLDGFLEQFPAAAFVAGHGEPGHALNVRFFRDYLFGLRQNVERAIGEGKSGQALVDAVMPLVKGRYGAWSWFDQFAIKNIEQTEQELRGTKKRPKASP
jgi:glyoxylase-like metal-dependent hydrolase (beta-lactamase superfamily II)